MQNPLKKYTRRLANLIIHIKVLMDGVRFKVRTIKRAIKKGKSDDFLKEKIIVLPVKNFLKSYEKNIKADVVHFKKWLAENT